MKRDVQNSLAGRADIQAALLGCALVAATAITVGTAFTLLPILEAWLTVLALILLLCVAAVIAAWLGFRGISNPSRRNLVNKDRLTGLLSRNAFETDLQNLHAGHAWKRTGMILVDLDNLKQVNDGLGHLVGDRYLRLAADAIRAEQGQRLHAYRVGGDELLLLVQNTSASAMQSITDRITARFTQLALDWPVPVSLSAGWAVFDPEQDKNLYDCYRRADQRMYQSKQIHRGG